MSYDVLIKDGEKAVLLLEETDDGRAFIASQFYSGISEKSKNRFEEEDVLVSNGFGIYRADATKYEENYDFEEEFDSLKKAIKYVKQYNKELDCECPTTVNVEFLVSNEEKPMANNVIAQYEIDAYFTPENLKKASKVLKDTKEAVNALDRVIQSLLVTRDKVAVIANNINANANAKSVEGTEKALEKAVKVLSALSKDEVFKYQLKLGNTKLEKDVKDFNAEEFLSEDE